MEPEDEIFGPCCGQ